jgi:hypothetical protein
MKGDDVRHFRGALAWFELDGDFRDVVPVEDAILRPERLLLEFSIDEDRYEASLYRLQESIFQGSWSCRGGRRANGTAECSLRPGRAMAQGSLILEGSWEEGGQRRDWFGRLTPVETSDD